MRDIDALQPLNLFEPTGFNCASTRACQDASFITTAVLRSLWRRPQSLSLRSTSTLPSSLRNMVPPRIALWIATGMTPHVRAQAVRENARFLTRNPEISDDQTLALVSSATQRSTFG